MFSDLLHLKDRVGKDNSVEPEDTLKTKAALKAINYYNEPDYGMTPYPDVPMFKGIGEFQTDNKLYFDEIMNPGGEPETAINKVLFELPKPPSAVYRGAKPKPQLMSTNPKERAPTRKEEISLLRAQYYDLEDEEVELLARNPHPQSSEVDTRLKEIEERKREIKKEIEDLGGEL
jgi:hypothetical protein